MAGVDHAFVEQWQQHGGFEAVHVLRGDRAGDVKGLLRAQPFPHATARTLRVLHQQAPVLGVGHGLPGGARGEDVGRNLAVVDVGYREGRIRRGDGPTFVAHLRQAGAVDGLIDHGMQARVLAAQLLQHLGRARRRQQQGLAAQQGRAQDHGEMMAPAAQIEERCPGRQPGGHVAHGCQVVKRADGASFGPEHGGLRRTMRNQGGHDGALRAVTGRPSGHRPARAFPSKASRSG